jgi:hypothetical protein
MDQAQKLFPLARGDCCLAFCGDGQVAYPFFIQVGTALDNYVKTRTRARDTTKLSSNVGQLLNNLVEAWNIPSNEKAEQLATTHILFAGWSWENKRFDIGFFRFERGQFNFHHQKAKLVYPWYEKNKSLVFIGDYEEAYLYALRGVLEKKYGAPAERNQKVEIEFNYEPIEALYLLLEHHQPMHTAIGGAPQLIKLYPYSKILPLVVRTDSGHFLLGRRLFNWEKTEYPVLDLTQHQAQVLYPMQRIPLPADITAATETAAPDEEEEPE